MGKDHFSTRLRTLALLTALSFTAILGIRGLTPDDSSTKAKGSAQAEVEIKNETESLQVVSKASVKDRFINLSLKNSSDKPITAFVVAFGRNKVTEEFIHDESKFVLPGNTCTKTYPLSPGTPTPEFRIRAVVFDDGTGEGNVNDVRAITETRLGQAMQYRRFLTALKEIEDASEFQLPSAWGRLKEKVSSFPDGKSEPLPVNVRYGLHTGKQDLTDEVQSLDLNPASSDQIRRLVKDLKARYIKIVPRYSPNKDSLTPAREM
ncbi:MAG TPA: hypothetical protein VE262_15935 [Blastocatellia bacterium]|nr:hypothetical protein [Blastocatellia bacterium]